MAGRVARWQVLRLEVGRIVKVKGRNRSVGRFYLNYLDPDLNGSGLYVFRELKVGDEDRKA